MACTFTAVLGRAALGEPIGARTAWAEQLRLLLELGARANVTLLVLPGGVGYHPGLNGPFTLYEFARDPAVLHFERYDTGTFLADAPAVACHRAALATMRSLALDPVASAELVERLAEQAECADGQ